MSWYWHEIGDRDSARYATTTAVWVSYLIAAMDGLLAFGSLIYHEPIHGVNAWGFLDAGLFVVVGWRIGRLSRTWAALGLCLELAETLSSIGTNGLSVGGVPHIIMEIIFLTTYINALRGTVAYHKYLKLQSAQPSESM